jgi:hypothetical protein
MTFLETDNTEFLLEMLAGIVEPDVIRTTDWREPTQLTARFEALELRIGMEKTL